jgi:polyketide biosynthesis enoyl-CoA hydratase PksH
MNRTYSTIALAVRDNVGYIQMARDQARNSLDACMIEELIHAVTHLPESCAVVVIRGGPQYFCFGADFAAVAATGDRQTDAIFDLLQCLHEAPLVVVCAVQGRVNAGGVGLVAAADVVIAEPVSTFSLSELLFGLIPACIYPFLVQRIGLAKARYLGLSTAPITAAQAQACGLVDEVVDNIESGLRRYLNRLRLLSPQAVGTFKRFHEEYSGQIGARRTFVMEANRRNFANPAVIESISRYQSTGKFPWED